MNRADYMAAVTEAMAAAQVDPEVGLVVESDAMRGIATHLPTEVLRAVVTNRIITQDRNGLPRVVQMHIGWAAACEDELIDRTLTENLSDEREKLQEEASSEESQRKETTKKGTPQVYR